MAQEPIVSEGGDGPLIVLIAGGAGDREALDATRRDIAENAVRGDIHVHVAPGGTPDFLAALKDATSRHPGEDVVLVAPGARLPFAWDARLRKGAYAAPVIAASIPMCDVSPLYALVDEGARPVSIADAILVDRAAFAMGQRSYYEVPRIHPVCAYLRRDALDAVLASLQPGHPQDVLDALTKELRSRGRASVILDYLYVGYSGPPDRPASSGDLEETAFLQHHPLGSLRRAVNDVIRRGLQPVSVPGLDPRPVQLHVMHFWGGGLDRWVRDFGRADASRINLVLASYRIGETGGQRVVLYSDPAAMIPIRTWDIARPIVSSAPSSIEYRRILEQILDEFDVEAIIVSSLIGHALDALTQPRKTIVVCHDFYPICQAVNPQFGKTCERCTLDDLRECARSNPLNNIFIGGTSEDWHRMRSLYVEHLLAGRVEMVVPSPSVAATLKRLEPRLDALPMHVVPHGVDFDAARLPVAPRAGAERLRLVVLGRLSRQKGTELLRVACAQLKPYADVTLLGCGANGVKLAEECGWNSVERYELGELPDRLRALAPHAGLLPSVVPETFSYTLSELWALGVPPIASALGSFTDRIADGVDGFLFQPDPQALVEVVRRLHERPELIATAARAIAARPRARTVAEMVADYHALVPLHARRVARFRVGIGRETALTEPYRHLHEAYSEMNEAYARLSDAYAHTTKAYEDTRAAYEHVRGELDSLKAAWTEWAREFDALRVGWRWWLAPRAQRLVTELRDKANLPKEKGEKQ